MVVAVSLTTALLAPASAQFDKGVAAFGRADYPTALRSLLPLAKQGNGRAQYLVGLMNLRGLGLPQNDAEAVGWLREAAEQGVSDAQVELGILHRLGRGVEKSDIVAKELFEQAAAQQNAHAQYQLGVLFERGMNLRMADPKVIEFLTEMRKRTRVEEFDFAKFAVIGWSDAPQAIQWYEKSVAQGFNLAKVNLANMLMRGQGTPADPARAMALLREASEKAIVSEADSQSVFWARIGLAMSYQRGDGGPKDDAEALAWFCKAAEINAKGAGLFGGALMKSGCPPSAK
jgi:hypothetical protein